MQKDAYDYECPYCPEHYGTAYHLYFHIQRTHLAKKSRQRRDEMSNEQVSSQSVDDSHQVISTKSGLKISGVKC